MKCPVCNVDLVMSDREGIEIDYCPQCRGVWLDRGELDKIVARSGSREFRDDYDDDDDDDYRRGAPGRGYRKYDDDDDRYHRPGRRRSFWSNLFDFD